MVSTLGLTANDIRSILTKVTNNGGTQSSTTAAQEPLQRYSARSEYQEPQMREEISYVYPSYDNSEGETEERNQEEIETSINALTFAFGKKNKKILPSKINPGRVEAQPSSRNRKSQVFI